MNVLLTGTKVRNSETERLGIVVNDIMSCCAEWETPVVYEGETYFTGTTTKLLENLGPENAKADLEKCGAGKGADCCRFLTVGANGPSCERFGPLRNSLIFKSDMTAKRDPAEPWPDCMNQSNNA